MIKLIMSTTFLFLLFSGVFSQNKPLKNNKKTLTKKKILKNKNKASAVKSENDKWFVAELKEVDFKVSKYYKVFKLNYKNKVTVFVNYKNNLLKPTQDLIKETIDMFYQNKMMTFDKITFYYEGDEKLSFVIYPKKVKSDIVGFKESLPSGFRFYYEQTLFYDFRIFSKNNYIRIKGPYWGMEDLLAKIGENVQSFNRFLEKENPYYLADQLSHLDKEMQKVLLQVKALEKKLADILGRKWKYYKPKNKK